MLDFNSRSALSDRINYLIDCQIDATAAESQRRDYLGASCIGHDCERHVQFHLLAARGEVERKQPEARIMRIFDRGNLYEERARQWLKDAGFLFGFTSTGKAFVDFDGEFRGHVDGILTGWKRPEICCPITLPALWECKCLASKYWRKLQKERLQEYDSKYYAQINTYMSKQGLQWCLFTAVNADTMEIYHEFLNLDVTESMLGQSRVACIINACNEGYMMQRISKDSSFYICKLCDFREVCWCP